MTALLDRARAESEEVPLAGNAPLLLDASPGIWIVETGAAEVFAVPREGEGPRTHLYSATAGQVLCGAANGTPLSLLAVGHAGTCLRRLPLDRLRELVRDREAAAALAAGLDG